MHRIQVQLTEAQERQLREMAELRSVSISFLIREGIDHLLAPANAEWERIKAAALAAVGSVDTRLTDLAENHDDYIGAALLEEIEENRA